LIRALATLPSSLALILSLLDAGCGKAGDPFKSSAYVQDVSTGSAVIALAATSQDTICVSWSDLPLDQAAQPTVVCEDEPTRIHGVRLSGLQPDMLYHYRVEDSTGKLIDESTFQTAALPGTRKITFVAVSDSGQVDENKGTLEGDLEDFFGGGDSDGKQRQVVAAILRSNPQPEVLLHCGDVIQGSGDRESYARAFFRPFGPLIDHVPILPVLGNHDNGSKHGAPWLDAFTTPANNPEGSERYYSFDWGDVHFVALDVISTPYESGTPQRMFLEQDLAATAAAWKVVYFHKAPYSDGRHGDNPEIIQELVPVFEQYHVDLVFSGHEHTYQRMKPRNGVTYIVVGSGGGELRGFKPSEDLAFGVRGYCYVRGTADAQSLTIEGVGLKDDVFDSVTLQH
jgi:predicted phosphodiesterase